MSTAPLFSVQSFAQSVRTKYPGAYDHLSDDDLVQKVVAKYPQYGSQIANYGLSSPGRSPVAPGLQGPPAPQYGQDVMQAAQRGTLRDQLMQDAQPYVQSAQVVGSLGAGPGQLAANVRGAGRVAGFAEKFLPWSKLSRSGEAIEGVSGSLADRVAASAPTLPETSLTTQAQGNRIAQRFGRPTSGAAMEEPLPTQQAGRVAQRFGRATSGRSTGARPPRPDLIEQMGGKPVEDLANSDAAVKERMEESPEFTYSKYAKAHQGKGSRTYPEPDYFQEQGPNRAPWGGNFPHQ